jgi:hypothetical protein
MADNVLNLSAFGEIIEPTGKRKYSPEPSRGPEPETGAEIIKLEPISTPKAPVAPVAPEKTNPSSSKTNSVASKSPSEYGSSKTFALADPFILRTQSS